MRGRMYHPDLSRKFVLSHADSFYTGGILSSFLKTVSDLVREERIRTEEFEIQFINELPPSNIIEDLQIQNIIRYWGRCASETDSLNPLRSSTAILFIQRTEGRGVVSERFYKLLGLNRFIMALVPNPENFHHIAASVDGVYIADMRDLASISRTLLRLYDHWSEVRTRLDRVSIFVPLEIPRRTESRGIQNCPEPWSNPYPGTISKIS